MQEVFISVWQRRTEVKIQSLKSYLQQATRFLALKAIREQKTDDRFYDRLKAMTTEIVIDNPLSFKEQQKLLEKIRAKLPEDCKEAFRLSREENMTYNQIVSQLNISGKTVEKRMYKSLKYFRRGLNSRSGHPNTKLNDEKNTFNHSSFNRTCTYKYLAIVRAEYDHTDAENTPISG